MNLKRKEREKDARIAATEKGGRGGNGQLTFFFIEISAFAKLTLVAR
jgi:hypothetical protein